MGYAFISYSSHDMEKADKLRNLFIDNNIDCRMAPYDVHAGSDWASRLTQVIRDCSCVALILTDAAQKSVNVKKEICLASTNYEKDVIAIQSEKIILNDAFKFYLTDCHIATVKEINEDDANMKKVLEAVKNHTGVKEKDDNESKKSSESEHSDKCSELHSIVNILNRISQARISLHVFDKTLANDLIYAISKDVRELSKNSNKSAIIESLLILERDVGIFEKQIRKIYEGAELQSYLVACHNYFKWVDESINHCYSFIG